MCAKIVTNTIFKKRLTMSVRFCMKIKTSGYIIPSVYKIHSLKFPSCYKIPSLHCVRFLDHAVLENRAEIQLSQKKCSDGFLQPKLYKICWTYSLPQKLTLKDFFLPKLYTICKTLILPQNLPQRILLPKLYTNCKTLSLPQKLALKNFSYQNCT